MIMTTSRFFLYNLGFFLLAAFTYAEELEPAGPPGSEAARMPALSQIEPRKIIDTIPFTISNSGPYVITRNLTGSNGFSGITIQTNSVILDLNGFALTGVSGSLDGIVVDRSSSFITIKNGVISGWGQSGVNAENANNSKVEDLLVAGNLNNGVSLGTNSMVARCTADNNGAAGFTMGSSCIVLDSIAKKNANVGFLAASGCLIQKCVANKNLVNGFSVDALGQIAFCTASENSGNGFNLGYSGSVVDSCAFGNVEGFHGWDGIVFSRSVAYSNTVGFYAARNCNFIDCSAYTNTWQGIYGDRGCVVSRCTAYANFDGIGASDGSKIADSSASFNSGHGYWLGPSTLLQGCSGSANTTGVAAQAGCYVSNNEICDSTALGITANNRCRIENNHVASSALGIEITGTDNILSGNTLLNNTSDYSIPDGNQLSLVVSRIPITIPWPARIRLSGTLVGTDVTNGITITANNVTVDMDGHALIGYSSSYDGIAVAPGCENIAINNGIISMWGQYGINAGNAFAIKVTGVQVHSNGFARTASGMLLGSNSIVRQCQAIGNKVDGLNIKGGSTIADSVFNRNGSDGIYATSGCSIFNCTASLNSQDGIASEFGGTIQSCVCSENSDDGIQVNTGNQVLNNTCDSNNYGINFYGDRNTIDGNSVTRSITNGIYQASGGNLIIRNRCSGNSPNYPDMSTSTYGPVVTGTGAIGSTSPWANFDF